MRTCVAALRLPGRMSVEQVAGCAWTGWPNGVESACYYSHRLRRRTQNVEWVRLRSRVNELFTQSRSAACSRSIVSMMQEAGEQIGRFKVHGLMRELALVSKQPGSHAYKKATAERPDIPNVLHREFDVPAPNLVGAATSRTSGRKGNGITWQSLWTSSRAELWGGIVRETGCELGD